MAIGIGLGETINIRIGLCRLIRRQYTGARGEDIPAAHPTDQNRKYRCAIGSTLAGSQVRISPSAFTV